MSTPLEDASSDFLRWYVSEEVRQAVPCLFFCVDITIMTKPHMQCVGQGKNSLCPPHFTYLLRKTHYLAVKTVC